MLAETIWSGYSCDPLLLLWRGAAASAPAVLFALLVPVGCEVARRGGGVVRADPPADPAEPAEAGVERRAWAGGEGGSMTLRGAREALTDAERGGDCH